MHGKHYEIRNFLRNIINIQLPAKFRISINDLIVSCDITRFLSKFYNKFVDQSALCYIWSSFVTSGQVILPDISKHDQMGLLLNFTRCYKT